MRENERKRKIIDYIKRNLKKGYTMDALKYALLSQGYLRVEVENSIEQATKEIAETAPVLKEKPFIKYEVFDEYNKPLKIKKPWWKKLFGL